MKKIVLKKWKEIEAC